MVRAKIAKRQTTTMVQEKSLLQSVVVHLWLRRARASLDLSQLLQVIAVH
jgi:hypothetical protein